MQRQRAADLAAPFDLLDLRGGDVPEKQPAPGRVHQPGGAVYHGGGCDFAELPLHANRGEQLLLSGDEFGAVDLEQRLPGPDRLTGEVDVQPLDVTGELRRHSRQVSLVVSDVAG